MMRGQPREDLEEEASERGDYLCKTPAVSASRLVGWREGWSVGSQGTVAGGQKIPV